MQNTIVNSHGVELHFDVVKLFMDDRIREEIHRNIAPCTHQEFFDAYAKAHEKRFGASWACDAFTPQM